MNVRVSVILVVYDGPAEALAAAVASLRNQSWPPAEVICVDQSPDERFGRLLSSLDPATTVLSLGENVGYSSACNAAAPLATGDYLFFLNPDSEADPECLKELAQVLEKDPGAAIAGAQVLLPDGKTVNAGDNTVHLSGLAWAGRYGQPLESGPPRPAAAVSGAAMMVRRVAFAAVGGYTEGFFMYYDDVDLAWRLRLESWEVLFCPRARTVHDYEFEKGSYKWRYLERNRWWCVLAHLQTRTLLLLLPLLLAVEVAVCLRASREGWSAAKKDSWRLLWRDRHALAARRRQIQASRRQSDRVIVERMRGAVDSPFLASPLLDRARPLLQAYRFVVLLAAW